MSNLLKIQYRWVAKDGHVFYEWQEHEYIDSYEGIAPVEFEGGLDSGVFDIENECDPLYSRFYRVKVNDFIYSIPEKVIVLIDKHTNTDYPKGTKKAWQDKVMHDELLYYYPKEDYVKAGKDFLGIDISAKKRSDKADYAQEARFNRLKKLQSQSTKGE